MGWGEQVRSPMSASGVIADKKSLLPEQFYSGSFSKFYCIFYKHCLRIGVLRKNLKYAYGAYFTFICFFAFPAASSLFHSFGNYLGIKRIGFMIHKASFFTAIVRYCHYLLLRDVADSEILKAHWKTYIDCRHPWQLWQLHYIFLPNLLLW